MKDSYSFDVDDAGLERVVRGAPAGVHQDLRPPRPRLRHRRGDVRARWAAAAARSSSQPTEVGEDTFVRCTNGDYAANIEAVTTPVPPPRPMRRPARRARRGHARHPDDRDARRARQRDGPAPGPALDGGRHAEERRRHASCTRTARASRWSSACPATARSTLKRLEAALAPAEVEAFGEADFAQHPGWSRATSGPRRSARTPAPASGTCSTRASSTGTRVDHRRRRARPARLRPRRGPRLHRRRHRRGGRGARGRPCPVCGGTLDDRPRHRDRPHLPARPQVRRRARPQGARRERQARHGHDGLLRHRRLPRGRRDRRGDARRARACCWPREVAPADVHVVATGKDDAVFEAAERIAGELESAGVRVLYDDRPQGVARREVQGRRAVGVPTILVVGKGLASGVVELKDRRTGEREDVPVGEVVKRVGGAGPWLSPGSTRPPPRRRRGHLRLGRHAHALAHGRRRRAVAGLRQPLRARPPRPPGRRRGAGRADARGRARGVERIRGDGGSATLEELLAAVGVDRRPPEPRDGAARRTRSSGSRTPTRPGRRAGLRRAAGARASGSAC